MTAGPCPSGSVPDVVPLSQGRRATGNLLAIGSMVVWAAGFPAAEELLARWEPLALVPARLLMGLVLFLPLWIVLEGWPRAMPWARCLGIGALGIGGVAVLGISRRQQRTP